MTYKDHFVVEVKSNGKILRVKDEAVFLPFGSEYTLLLKNLYTRRASVKISIDGQDVLDGHSLILDANETTELQGFLKGNVAKNRFRFIQKTKQISDHRGDRADDGLIRVEFAFEKPLPEPLIKKTIEEVHHHHYYHNPLSYTYYGSAADWKFNDCQSSGNARGIEGDHTIMYSNSMPCSAVPESNVTMDSLGIENKSEVPNIDEGITVKGSEVYQQFNYASMGELEKPNVIIIQLKGIQESGTKVSQPITVKDKLTCSSCGTKSSSSFKFCPNCGTFLE